MIENQPKTGVKIGKRLLALGAVSLFALASAPAFAEKSAAPSPCPADFSGYQVKVFSATNTLGVTTNPTASVVPYSSYNGATYKVLGGGAIVTTIQGDTFLTASYPLLAQGSSSPTGWIGESKDVGSGTHLARITVYAIAVLDPANCWDVKAFQNSTTTAVSHPSTSVNVASGYTLTGGGGKTIPLKSGGHGNFLYASIPTNGGSGTYNGWQASSKDNSIGDVANITAYAIGIRAVGAGVINPTNTVKSSQERTADNYPFASVYPYYQLPVGTTCIVTGGGADDNWSNGWGNMLTATYPPGTEGWEAFGRYNGTQSPSIMTAYSVCLN